MRIVGYTYRAEMLCGPCTIASLPTGEGEAFEGWRDDSGTMSTEDNLNEIAAAFGIERQDETTYDSDDFPKVIFASQVEEDDDCHACGYPLN